MNHYCTFFDRGYLIQGLALWRSLAANDVDAVLWILALDDETVEVLKETGGTWLRVVSLAELEMGDEELAAAKGNRSRVEYLFTLQAVWPRWLLARQTDVDRVTYIDADMLFFSSPAIIFTAMDAAHASIVVTAHRFPAWLGHYAQHGQFNVGIISFRRDPIGMACLDDWRARCLAWCRDRVEDGKYASQRYLDAWPARFGAALLVLPHPGVNLAPWNWAAQPWEIPSQAGEVPLIDGQPLVLFHFARFRPIFGTWWWQSGQIDYGVMPLELRRTVYGRYWRALAAARDEIRAQRPDFDFPERPLRLGRNLVRSLPLGLVFGGDWLRVGDSFWNLRVGLGRFSGRSLNFLRWLARRRPSATT